MGFIINTKCHTYRLEDTNDETIKLITGGRFRENEIKVFSDMDDAQRTLDFVAYFTKNPCNKGYSGRVRLGNIQSINMLPCIQVVRPNVQSSERVENAGQFFVMDNNGRDIATMLRNKYHVINDEVCAILGDNTNKQRVYITDTVIDGKSSQCTVICLIDDNTDDVWFEIQNIILSELDNYCICSVVMFIEKTQMNSIKQNHSQKQLRLKETSKTDTNTSINSRVVLHPAVQPVFNLG